jgi:ribosome recycling factor
MDALKKLEKDHKISQDEHRQRSDEVQKATDQHIKLIDDALAQKEKEIMHV